jgi:hypothetical protein
MHLICVAPVEICSIPKYSRLSDDPEEVLGIGSCYSKVPEVKASMCPRNYVPVAT